MYINWYEEKVEYRVWMLMSMMQMSMSINLSSEYK